jgi:hypothetical protein
LLLRNFWGHLQHRSDHQSLPHSYSGDSDLLRQLRQAANATSAHVGTLCMHLDKPLLNYTQISSTDLVSTGQFAFAHTETMPFISFLAMCITGACQVLG